TGYNETMADTAFRWLDDAKHFTKRAELRKTFDALLGTAEGTLDPAGMIERMIEIVPSDTGKFRNVCPQFVEDMLKKSQLDAWDREIGDPAMSHANDAIEELNKRAVAASFAAWADGTGSPYDLLADDARWTIVGHSLAAKTYPSREAFL